MPRRCVFGCDTTGVAIHRFPNPRIFQERFRIWVSLAGGSLSGLTDMQIYNNRTVCDKHFAEKFKNRNHRLNSLAIPHLHLPNPPVESKASVNLQSDCPTSPCTSVQLSASEQAPKPVPASSGSLQEPIFAIASISSSSIEQAPMPEPASPGSHQQPVFAIASTSSSSIEEAPMPEPASPGSHPQPIFDIASTSSSSIEQSPVPEPASPDSHQQPIFVITLTSSSAIEQATKPEPASSVSLQQPIFEIASTSSSLLCPKRTYTKPIKKVNKPTSESNNVEKTSRRAGKVPDLGVPLTTKIAVEFLLNGKLKTSVCRYCLKVTVGLSELDQIMQIAGTGVMYKVSIREMIACFYPFKARQEESFPEKICQRCIDRAINAYLFTQQCEQAERALYNCFDDMNEKFNKLDPVDGKKKRGRQKLNPNPNTLYAEHHLVMDYAEPLRNIINLQTESLSNEPDWNEFECKKCWEVLPDLESLLNHEQIHPKHMWYHCRLCGKSFVKIHQLKKHFNQVHIRGKRVTEEVDKTFKCKECGNVTENYIQHLQHIEKHKFKSIMKHLIEKKTDQLCLVCLKQTTDLVELEKMVCIHGSCPELVGDKSLYTVLASTLPDPKSYKYQELHIPRKADIMTITKRKRKYKEIQNIPHITQEIQFKLSLPKIVTKDRFKTDDFYYYVFCEPQAEDIIICTSEHNIATQDTESLKIFEITDEETMDCNLDDIMPTGNECMSVIQNFTGVKILVNDKELVNAAENYNPAGMVMEKTAPLNTLKDVVKNYINQKELIGNANPGDKNVTGHIESVDMIVDPINKILPDDEQKQTIDLTGNSNIKDIINVKKPMDAVGHLDPEKDRSILFEVKEHINLIERDDSEDTIFIDKKNARVLIDQNNLDNPKFFFSNPIVLEFDHNMDADIAPIFNFSNPDHGNDRETNGSKQIKEMNLLKYDIIPMTVKNDLSWISPEAFDSKKLFNFIEVTDNVTNVVAKSKTKERDCKFCWLFKHLNKCEYCKKPIDTGVKMINESKQFIEKNTFNFDKSNISIEKPIKTTTTFNKSVEIQTKPNKNAKEPKIEKIWQCNVCLTNNNKNRSTCHCCESKKKIDNGNCKVPFGNNKSFFTTALEKEPKLEKEANISVQETKPFIVIDETTMTDTQFVKQENLEVQMDNIGDTNSIYSMDMETDSVNYTLNTINEDMDVEEEPFIPYTIQKIDPVPILAANFVPHVASNTQFNIGSNPIQYGKGVRKFKRAVRNIPKAFHK